MVLDASPDLSLGLVSVVSEALTSGEDVERAICNFCNVNADEFDLSRTISAEDLIAIRQTFEHTYRIVTTGENRYMDDFMILDKEATGKAAKFVTHQGSICVDFAEIIDPTAASSNPDYFASIRADFTAYPAEVSHRNESVAGGVEIDVETLLARISDEQLERLPTAVKKVIRAHMSFQVRQFLQYVAKGKQDEAEALLTATPANTQTLLRTPGVFTDYSGRTFNCTAYEYAYWAKDTHMCRMLEAYMDVETKAVMAARIDEMERTDPTNNQPTGLVYSQNGAEHRSAHFDFTPLNEAYQRYIYAYDFWLWHVSFFGTPPFSEKLRREVDNALWDVGKAQRNAPAHVAHEYCRPDRSFDPMPEFNEVSLPRVLTVYNWRTGCHDTWFPLANSKSGLGFDFAVIRKGEEQARGDGYGGWSGVDKISIDLSAIRRLDEVRTAELTHLREHFNWRPRQDSNLRPAP